MSKRAERVISWNLLRPQRNVFVQRKKWQSFFFAFSQCSCGASAAPMQESSESDEDTD